MWKLLYKLYLLEKSKMQHQIKQLLSDWGQLHLFEGVESLSGAELRSFLDQLQKYDSSLAFKQKQLLAHPNPQYPALPCSQFARSGNPEDFCRGEQLLRQGQVGCLILAGGQGTRLKFDGPKGAFPLLDGKSLFQIFCEKVKQASLLAGINLPLCLMTSELNHQQTVDFFHEHDCFGLEASQLSFFTQEMLPFLSDSGDWILEKPGKILEGPDGNGHALHLFYKTGLWRQWKEKGVEYLNVIFVDNALADPFDPEFVGFTVRKGVDAALKAVERLKADEKMGAVAERDGKLKVIEYFELPSNASEFTLSSTGMFCLSMSFIEHLCKDLNAEFPLHLSRKNAVWKCERFLFDLLHYARSSAAFVCPREKIYAPLKNATGEHSLETVQKALLKNLNFRSLS